MGHGKGALEKGAHGQQNHLCARVISVQESFPPKAGEDVDQLCRLLPTQLRDNLAITAALCGGIFVSIDNFYPVQMVVFNKDICLHRWRREVVVMV